MVSRYGVFILAEAVQVLGNRFIARKQLHCLRQYADTVSASPAPAVSGAGERVNNTDCIDIIQGRLLRKPLLHPQLFMLKCEVDGYRIQLLIRLHALVYCNIQRSRDGTDISGNREVAEYAAVCYMLNRGRLNIRDLLALPSQ